MYDSVLGADRSAWNARAARYREHVAPVTRQAIAPLLHAAGDLEAVDLLDVGCGAGDLVAEACARGARAHGIDVAQAMVGLARDRHAACRFRVGDAHALDVATASCHVVTCAFALEHLADPDRALAEMHRVLRPGGVLLCALRRRPDPRDAFVAVLHGALRRHGTGTIVSLADGASTWRFAGRAGVREALLGSRFDVPLFHDARAEWTGHRGAEALGFLHGAFVRASALLESRPAPVRASIEATIVRRTETLARRGSIVVPWRWHLVRARPDAGVRPGGGAAPSRPGHARERSER